MTVLVVFESMFGNTKAVAEAVADGLGTRFEVELVDVAHAPAAVPADVELLVVGGPTHAFGMSRRQTRQSAADQAGTTATPVSSGLREWLADMTPVAPAMAAAFDTRIKVRGMPGSAARGAQKRLRRLGFRVVAPAASFWVAETAGPLRDGELERARRWGEELAALVPTTSRR